MSSSMKIIDTFSIKEEDGRGIKNETSQRVLSDLIYKATTLCNPACWYAGIPVPPEISNAPGLFLALLLFHTRISSLWGQWHSRYKQNIRSSVISSLDVLQRLSDEMLGSSWDTQIDRLQKIGRDKTQVCIPSLDLCWSWASSVSSLVRPEG